MAFGSGSAALGLGGQSYHGRQDTSTTQTTPWTNIANQLAGLLKTQLGKLGGGSSITEGVQALTASSERQTKEGIANIKESMGKSGMRFSSDVGKNIADFQTGQTTALGTRIAQFQQQAVQQQLSALAEIISLASGSGTTTGKMAQAGGGFGWNLALAGQGGFGAGGGK